ncbi:MAG: hypothetical protein JWL76_325 [Thermoleophilia bacterium]|nr:hypothetical protein [Thermoleophilia bacterium]
MGILAIFSLLLAIAVPTFSAQKSNAQATQVKANVKQVVYAVESCAAVRVDGTYTGSDSSIGPDCLDPAVLLDNEPALGPLHLGTAPAADGGYQVAPVGSDGTGYMIQAASEASPTIWFAELHLTDGQILKLCDTRPLSATDRSGGTIDGQGCSAGTW